MSNDDFIHCIFLPELATNFQRCITITKWIRVLYSIVSNCCKKNRSIQKLNYTDGENRLCNPNKESIFLRILVISSPKLNYNDGENRLCNPNKESIFLRILVISSPPNILRNITDRIK